MLRDGQAPEDCRALSDVLGRIGDRWTILLIGLLGEGPMRFNEIRRTIEGISQRMLTLTLRGLERDGFIVRTEQPTHPPTVEYRLSELGLSLLGPLTTLAQWGREHRGDIERSRERFVQLQEERAQAAEPPPGVRRHSTRGR